jgi:acetyltransferase-like isoleucine patch superfamily enzyme
VIESGCRIGNSVWIGPGAVIGMGATIGDNTTVGPGVIIGENVKIGKQCEILLPGLYRENMADKTFHAPGYDGPVRIVKF